MIGSWLDLSKALLFERLELKPGLQSFQRINEPLKGNEWQSACPPVCRQHSRGEVTDGCITNQYL